MNIVPFYQPFPVDALPDALLKPAQEAMQIAQAPAALVASSAISAASFAAQNLVDIQRREHLVGPAALILITLCESGERKTTVDNLFTQSIRKLDRQRDHHHQERLLHHEGELAIWQVKKRTAERALARSLKEGSSVEHESAALAAIVSQKPTAPTFSPLLLADATPAAIKQALSLKGSGIGVFSSEASGVFNGKAFSELAFLNELWDGGTTTVDRVTTGRWAIDDCRLTGSLMAQPIGFTDFMTRQGRAARELGFLARTPISYPPTTQGTRFLNTPASRDYLKRFNDRVVDLQEQAEKQRACGPTARQLLRFSWQAQRRWDEIFNIVEGSVGAFGCLAPVKDYAAKYADNLARLAAIFHCFEGCEGDISLDTLERAQAICSWYLESFKHLFLPPPQPINFQPAEDAEKIKVWLVEQYVTKGIVVMERKRLSQYGPYRQRPIHRLDPALNHLIFLQVILPPRPGRPLLVELHPFFLNDLRSQGIVPQVPILVT